ncbi:cytochrome-c oxidase [bacterium]|nr:cytochrome-c oxidase [bacterium]
MSDNKSFQDLFHAHDDHLHGEPTSFISKYIISYDHKVIAKQFLFFGLFWAFVGAFMSVLIRWALAFPGKAFPIVGSLLFPHTDGVIPPDAYTMLFTMHGTIMIFFAITPILIGTLGNFCIPLMIGARDMLFPWLNMASFWMTFAGGVVMFASLFVPLGASAVGWTSYPTLAHAQWSPGWGHSLWIISIFLMGNASIMGAINYIATIIRLRAPGLTAAKLPLTIWGLLLTAVLNALFIPVLAAGLLLLLMDRMFGTSFYLAAAISQNGTQGDPILYQHLFWIFGHPEVYIIILPAWGMVSDFLSFFSRKPAFGAKWTAGAFISITLLSTVVYGHHMFTTGMSPLLTGAFTTLTLLISIPSGIFFLNWLGTLWRGNIQFTSPMLFSLGVVITFGIGGLTGLHLGAVPTNLLLHNSYFVVGHFHLTMAVASLLGTYAAVYFWFPKMFGKMLSEKLAKIHFWTSFLPIMVIFVGMMVAGYAGMHRRIYNPYEYTYLEHLLFLNRYISLAAFLAFASQFIFLFNFFYSWKKGEVAGSNPWKVGTLEWTTPTPVPVHNFDVIPEVFNGPHEFSHPKLGDSRDWISQTEYLEGISTPV